MAQAIDHNAQDYIRKHAEKNVTVGSVLFDRRRNFITVSPSVGKLFPELSTLVSKIKSKP